MLYNSIQNPALYNPALYQLNSVHKNDLVENSDWSGRHVRLKYQMMVSSLVLYLLVGTKIEDINLFGFIKYEGDFPEGQFFALLLVFSIFSVFAFILRSFFESSRWSSLRKDMRNVVANIKINESLVKDVFDFQEKRALALEVLSLIEEPNDDFSEEFVDKFNQLRFEKRTGKLRQLNDAISNINNDISNLKNSLEHIRPGYQPEITDYSTSLSKISGQLSTLFNSIENVERELDDSRRSKTEYERIRNNLLRYSDAIVSINETFPELNPKSDVLKRNEFRRAIMYLSQNIGVSVIFPVCSAIALIGFSLAIQFNILAPL